MRRVIICGGGLSGSVAAIAIARRRPDVDLLLLERGQRFGGTHIWSFFDTDIQEGSRWLADMIAARRWPDHEIRFPKRARRLAVGYNSIQSHDLDTAVRSSLAQEQYRLACEISTVAVDHVVIDGQRIDADCVIDARGLGPTNGLELGWQKFVGRVYRFPHRHSVSRPVVMDATIPQIDGFRFAYLLPLGPAELLIEDTYYSSSSLLDREQVGARVDELCDRLTQSPGEIVSEEHGVLPVLMQGDLEDLWPSSDVVPRLGLAGGFFHPTTGYSLADALDNAVLLANQRDLSASAVNRVLRGRAERVWRERKFFQLLNRMLFRAAEPVQRYRVLEHFYRLPMPVISRFYASRLTPIDKFRILSGKPPVPIGRALSAIRRRAA